ncbi:hypothetical protein D3C78_879720 [compost metagenome]
MQHKRSLRFVTSHGLRHARYDQLMISVLRVRSYHISAWGCIQLRTFEVVIDQINRFGLSFRHGARFGGFEADTLAVLGGHGIVVCSSDR